MTAAEWSINNFSRLSSFKKSNVVGNGNLLLFILSFFIARFSARVAGEAARD